MQQIIFILTIRGVNLKKGKGVIAFLASANRDESKFERAHEFDIHRHPNPHIGIWTRYPLLFRLPACTAGS
ncbi:hypothetical protein [Bacillus swezeyi]|uniref:hypothetical protein n=1 Tax=Bacillus swezeyi TaxID=1925020 RepID=UPI00398A7392